MAKTDDMEFPSDAELQVPQEITLSSPWMKAMAPYMGIACEKEMNEFMLLRREYGNDPRKVLKEGREVTACGVNFLRRVRQNCLQEATEYADCFDKKATGELLPYRCRRQQYPMDICADEKLGIRRPPIGHFSKLHVHEASVPRPEVKPYRDYKTESQKVMDELPPDWNIDTERFYRVRPATYNLIGRTF